MPLIGRVKMASCPEKKDIMPVRITKLSPEKGCSQTSAQSKSSPLSPEKKKQENQCSISDFCPNSQMFPPCS